jgi:hypothetical protein
MLPTGPDLDPKAASGAVRPTTTPADCGPADKGALAPANASGGGRSGAAGTAAPAKRPNAG